MNDFLIIHAEIHRRSGSDSERLVAKRTAATLRVKPFQDALLKRDAKEKSAYHRAADFFEQNLMYVDDIDEECAICRVDHIGGTVQDPVDLESSIYPKVRSHRGARFKACQKGHAFGLTCLFQTFCWRTDEGFKVQDLPWLCPYCRTRIPPA